MNPYALCNSCKAVHLFQMRDDSGESFCTAILPESSSGGQHRDSGTRVAERGILLATLTAQKGISMFVKCSTIVLALILVNGTASECMAESGLRGPLRLGTSDGAFTVAVGGIHARSENVSLFAKKDGAFLIRLSGNTTVEVGDLRASAQAIEASVPEIGHRNGKDEELHFRLEGSVQLEIEGVRAKVNRTGTEAPTETLRLTADEARSVRLEMESENGKCLKTYMVQLSGNAVAEIGETRVTAQEIELLCSKHDRIRLRLLGGVQAETEEATVKTDRMAFELARESSD